MILTKEKRSKKEKLLITRITLSSYFRLLTVVTSSLYYYNCKGILVYNPTCKLIVGFLYLNCKLFLGRYNRIREGYTVRTPQPLLVLIPYIFSSGFISA